jgi:hypothetical protein
MLEEGVLDLETKDSSTEEIDERIRDEAAGRDGGAILTESRKGSFLCGLHFSEDI